VNPVTLNVLNARDNLKQIVYLVLISQYLKESSIVIQENVFVQTVIISRIQELVKNRSVVNVTYLAVNVLDLPRQIVLNVSITVYQIEHLTKLPSSVFVILVFITITALNPVYLVYILVFLVQMVLLARLVLMILIDRFQIISVRVLMVSLMIYNNDNALHAIHHA
jgi:hypothetical protein